MNFRKTNFRWLPSLIPRVIGVEEIHDFDFVIEILSVQKRELIIAEVHTEAKTASAALQEMPGIGETSAQAILAVIGTDMSRFPTAGHLASWAGVCPGNNESAGKRKSGRTTKGNCLLREVLIACAHSAVLKKDTYFCAQFQRISSHRGKKRAYVAVAHSMLIAIYHMLKDGVVFKDLGADYYNQFNRERKINACLRKLEKLGYRAEVAAT